MTAWGLVQLPARSDSRGRKIGRSYAKLSEHALVRLDPGRRQVPARSCTALRLCFQFHPPVDDAGTDARRVPGDENEGFTLGEPEARICLAVLLVAVGVPKFGETLEATEIASRSASLHNSTHHSGKQKTLSTGFKINLWAFGTKQTACMCAYT